MKTILVIEDNPKAPHGIDISTMRILTEQELENAALQKTTKAGAMMQVIEKILIDVTAEIKQSVSAKEMPGPKEDKPCLH